MKEMDFLSRFFPQDFPDQDLQGSSLGTSSGGTHSRYSVEIVRRDLSRLALAVEAMWELTGGAQGLKMEDLAKKMHEIDLRDGTLDGQNVKRQRLACPKCGKVLQQNTPKCIYCGQEVFLEPF